MPSVPPAPIPVFRQSTKTCRTQSVGDVAFYGDRGFESRSLQRGVIQTRSSIPTEETSHGGPRVSIPLPPAAESRETRPKGSPLLTLAGLAGIAVSITGNKAAQR